MYAPTVLAAGLDSPGHYLHVGPITIGVANLVVMLASPLMHMVNGTMIEIDGGQDKPLMDRFRDKPKG